MPVASSSIGASPSPSAGGTVGVSADGQSSSLSNAARKMTVDSSSEETSSSSSAGAAQESGGSSSAGHASPSSTGGSNMLVGTNPDYFLPGYFVRTPARLLNIPFA